MHFHSETAVFNACRTLFGNEVNLSRDFLNYLQPSGAKTAFRSQAKAHHPDAHASSSTLIRNQQTERFREIRQAYDLIIDFLENRHSSRKTATAKKPSQTSSQWRDHSSATAQASETSRQAFERYQRLPWNSACSATTRGKCPIGN